MTISILVGTAFLAAPLIYLCVHRWNATLTALLPAFLFFGFVSYLPHINAGQVVTQTLTWIPSLGISLSFQLDALALLFALLITGIGTFIFLYASAYLKPDWRTPRFFTALTIFMASMLGAILSDDLLSLAVFWELTSLSSFMLIGYDATQSDSRRSAQQGLLITVGGGFAMLAGMILLGTVAGTYRISEIIALDLSDLLSGSAGTAIVALVAIGAFSKSAQAPLHAWLANAMVAPTPVSAYLHSATMVKLGVYLLARLNPALSDVALWTPLLLWTGAATMLTGLILAIRHTDLKRILAYSTIVSLGTLIMLIGINHPLAAMAMGTFLLIHALYKACLFMIAGIIDHCVGTRNSAELGGLATWMPITAGVAGLAALSMAGIPPLFGFVGKEFIYETGLAAQIPHTVFAVIILSNACMVAIAALIGIHCFFGKQTDIVKQLSHAPRDPSIRMWFGPLVLAILGLTLGLMPFTVQNLLALTAGSIYGEPVSVPLGLWHGFSPALALSVLTLALGFVLYLRWDRIQTRLMSCKAIDNWGTDALYDKGLHTLVLLANWQTRHIQTGSLRHYMAMSIGFIAIAVLIAMIMLDGFTIPDVSLANVGMEMVLPFLLIAAAIMVLRSRSFVQGLISAGAVGFGVAVVFLLGGAPDLAFTQFSVEALSVVILLAIIGHMPFRAPDPRPATERGRDALIAAGFGLMVVVVMFSVVTLPFDEALSNFFRESSYPLAHGRNLVNVIIVDFRALDTLGEITVLALAALAAMAVFFSNKTDRATRSESSHTQPPSTP